MAAITSNKGTYEPVARNSVTTNKITLEYVCCALGRWHMGPPSFGAPVRSPSSHVALDRPNIAVRVQSNKIKNKKGRRK
jgi:hypothetical protein